MKQAQSNRYVPPKDNYAAIDKVVYIKSHYNKLKPLFKPENCMQNVAEREFPHKLNSLPQKCTIWSNQKEIPSKIPILQVKACNAVKQKVDIDCDTILSAADRRQKFHQSHLRLADVPNKNKVSGITQKGKNSYQDVIAWYESYAFQKVLPCSIPRVNRNTILPPIKSVEAVSTVAQSISQANHKCLFGEITHFPALCNPVHSKVLMKSKDSSVPHLPLINSLPDAPPLSISASLEDANKLN